MNKTAPVAFLCSVVIATLHVQFLQLAEIQLWSRESQTNQPLLAPTVNPITSKLPLFLKNYSRTLERSDFVELEHCSLHDIEWTNFTAWARPIIGRATMALKPSEAVMHNDSLAMIQNEWMLELLEMHATHSGICNFTLYQPNIKPTAATLEAGIKLQQVVKTIPTPQKYARIAFSIVAYQDATHLKRLIEAIHMPHHLIIIHLDQRTDPEFYKTVVEISSAYSNAVIVQFGTVIYKTDAVSRINLQLMDWLVNDLQLDYDYHCSLGGAVYPLYGASELAQHLYSVGANVWLGELTHKGERVHHPQWGALWKKRLLTTSLQVTQKVGFLFEQNVPSWMDASLQHKSISGNQAVFSLSTVKRMLDNPKVKNLFALAKYGCCCCIEERSWIAAMHVLDLLEEAKHNFAMYQLWGGETGQCVGSMHNAILDADENRCFRLESPNADELYIWGNSTWDNLVRAKGDGVLFARKFHSGHNGSTALLKKIRIFLHE